MAILFIDCYDSFTYNLVNLIKEALPDQEVIVVHNDQVTETQLTDFLTKVEAVVVGPGPGSPMNASDAGIIKTLWSLANNVPILGICFGLQSLAFEHGGDIKRLKDPQHGQYGYIKHNENALFTNIPQNYKVIRYHSLYAEVNTDNLEILATCTTDNCIMALKHSEFPFYAVQFHPESVLSEYGAQLIKNFWELAKAVNIDREIFANDVVVKSGLHINPLISTPKKAQSPPLINQLDGKYSPLDICESLKENNQKFTLLESRAFPGEWSIIGLIDAETTFIRSKGDTTYIGSVGSEKKSKGDPWAYIAEFMSSRLVDGQFEIPFIGGLVGYITYEMACGVESPSNSDLSFVFIENCILIKQDGTAFTVGSVGEVSQTPARISSLPLFTASTPAEDEYVSMVQKCKEYLYSGDSYELCLTGQTLVEFEEIVEPWELYKRVGSRNPAPYAIFMDFDDILVGSSPERFMSWNASGDCQFRPIKGTVKKAPGVDFEVASKILSSKKEQGENLMIVDLIRHDLGQILERVSCPQAMRVEEYKTVYQLVSVIEGDLSDQNEYTGIDVLRHSLPPGSMTGAPKKRSVEILRELESQPRGLYSGVAGYWSLNDTGDWSVVIRSAFQYKGEHSKWRLGAGGAITVLSNDHEEFEEMVTKLHSAFQAFSNES